LVAQYTFMPTIKWNKNWEKNIVSYLKDPKNEKFFGERWGDPNQLEMLRKIRDKFILPFINEDQTALEIGSGGGRWTQFLLKFKRLYCVELNPTYFHYLIVRFGAIPNISFCKTNGTDLPGIQKNSIDFLFSFGTFVHLDVNLIKEYLKSIKDVIKEETNIVIQYSEKKKPQAASNPGFSENTADVMRKLVDTEGFSIISEDLDTLPHSNVIQFKVR